ncbi:hypothetical protein [Zavarzinella formosa]|uniref:hypothetical protein n=1 Tax=Zavarzinella formosa TaxID=360055 RepID=UPI0012F95F9B|nr:hypothetical protein [Zavarzinella formosa]
MIGNRERWIEAFFRTDGIWVFPGGLGYYIRMGIRLPRSFVGHVRKANYQPPAVTLDLDNAPTDRCLNWMLWSLLHTNWRPLAAIHLIRMIIWIPVICLMLIFGDWITKRISLRS